mmetsp:Transcript_1349/g.2371  ORF Transcript_1349/g.2371 Transcript_1349/m.2371 type:complete len:412 (+) Transcript_1349:98-1333(+)
MMQQHQPFFMPFPHMQNNNQQQPIMFMPQHMSNNNNNHGNQMMYMNMHQMPYMMHPQQFANFQQQQHNPMQNNMVAMNNNKNNNNNNTTTTTFTEKLEQLAKVAKRNALRNSNSSGSSPSSSNSSSSSNNKKTNQSPSTAKRSRYESVSDDNEDQDEDQDQDATLSSGSTTSNKRMRNSVDDTKTDSGRNSEDSASSSDCTESNSSIIDSSSRPNYSPEEAAKRASEAAAKAQLQVRHLQQRKRRRRARRNRAPDCPHSDYRGVSWHRRDRKWLARTWINGRIEHLGCFRTEEMAALAVDLRTIEHFGPDTKKELNFSELEERERLRREFDSSGEFKIKTARELNGPGNYAASKMPAGMRFTTVFIPGFGPVAAAAPAQPGAPFGFNYDFAPVFATHMPQGFPANSPQQQM